RRLHAASRRLQEDGQLPGMESARRGRHPARDRLADGPGRRLPRPARPAAARRQPRRHQRGGVRESAVVRAFRPLLFLTALTSIASARAGEARTFRVSPRQGAVEWALHQASAGDTLLLASGVHQGRVRIAIPLTLRGEPGAVLEGSREGSVLTIEAPGTVV